MLITSEQLARAHELLLEKRNALAGHIERLAQEAVESTEATENSKTPLSSAENAAEAYEQDFAFISMESEERLLRKVDRALQRLREQTYGECEECGEEINAERLEAVPWATMCVKCQELEERGMLRGKQEELDFAFADEENEEAFIGDESTTSSQ